MSKILHCTIARCQKKNKQHFINKNNSLYAWTIARTYCKSESFNSDGVKESLPKPLQDYSKEYGKHRLYQTIPLCAPHLKFVIKKNLVSMLITGVTPPLGQSGIFDNPVVGLVMGDAVQLQETVHKSKPVLGIHLPSTIRVKIWVGSLSSFLYCLCRLMISNMPTVQVNWSKVNWSWTGNISVYLEKFPGTAQAMLRHMHNIRLAACRVDHNA